MTLVKIQAQLLCFFRRQVGEEMPNQWFTVAEVLEIGLCVFTEQVQAAGWITKFLYQILPDLYCALTVGWP